MTELCPPPEREARTTQRLRTCKVCKFSTTSPRDFLHHQINAHSQDLDVAGCDQCDYVATSEIEIERHKKMQHISTKRPSVDESEPGTPNSVEGVDGQFDLNSTDGKLDDNTVVRSGVNLPTRTYTCTECGWSTTSSRQNLYHMVHDHGYDYTIYECDICDYATRYKQKLPRHRKCHFMSPIASPTLTSSSLSSPIPVTIAPISSMEEMKSETGSPHKDINENVKPSILMDGNYTESEEKTATSLLALGMAHGLTQRDLAEGGELVLKAKLGTQGADSTSVTNNEDDMNPNTSFNDEEAPLVIDTDRVSEPVTGTTTSISDVPVEGGAFVTGSSLPLKLPEPPTLTPKSTTTISLSEFNTSGMTLPTLEKKPDLLPKPKKPGGPIREAVDPAKYIRVQDVDGIKYACSKCGNIYKWRKSLNKHWKEKHDGEIPTPVNPARFTMLNVPRGNGGRSLTSLPIVKTTVPTKPLAKTFSTAKSFLSAASPTMVKDAYRSPMVYEMRPMSNTMVENKPKWTTSSSSSELEALRAKWGIPATITETKPMVTRPLGSAIANFNILQSRANPNLALSLGDKKKSFSSSNLPGNSSPFSIPAAHSSGHKESETCDEAPLDLSMGSSSTPTATTPSGVDIDVLDLSKARASAKLDGLSLTTQADATRYPSVAKQSLSGLLPCYRCTFKARSRREYEDHQEFHRQEWHMCAVCEKQFPSVEELNVHFASHHAEVLHERCLSENERDEFRHRIKTENDPDSFQLFLYLTQPCDISKCYCVICALFFTWETELARHFDESHLGLPNPYKKRHSEDGQEPDPKKPRFLDEETLQCGQCMFSARDPAELKKHFLVHTLNRPFACTMCGYSTRAKNDLEQHILRYHTEAKQESAVSQQEDSPESGMEVDEDDKSSGEESVEMDKQQYLSQLGLFSNSSPISYKVNKPSSPAAVVQVVKEAPVTPPRNLSPSPRKPKSGNKTPTNSNTEVLLPYKCNVCEYRARWPSEIAQHMKNHSDEKPFRCPRCSYKSKWKWDVVKHLKRCGGGTVKDVIDETKEKPQWSRPLNFTVTTTKGLSSGPPNVTVVREEETVEMADNKEDTKLVPYSRGIEEGKDTKNSSQLHCLQCQFVAASPWELTRHMRLHSDEKPYTCQTCGYGSKWKCDLKKHLRTYNHSAFDVTVSDDADDKDGSGSGSGWDNYPHSDSDEEMTYEKPELLRCEQCQYVTYKPNQLEAHLKIHQQGAAKKSTGIKCKQCDFEASDLPAFLQHKLAHDNNNTDAPKSPSVDNDLEALEQDPKMTSPRNRRKPQKPFSCPECTFSCFLKPQLEEHMQVHAGNVELSCSLCSYVGISRPSLEDHINTSHALESRAKATTPAEKPRVGKFQCAKCPFITSHRSNYEKHIRSHGLNLRFKCDWCDWSIDRLNLLLRHSRCVHPVEMAAKEARAKVTSSDELQTDTQVMNDLRRDYLAQVKVKSPPMRRHMKTRYACKKCKFATFNMAKIKEHYKLHDVKAKYNRNSKKIRNSWVFVNKSERLQNGESQSTVTNHSSATEPDNKSRKGHKCPDCPYGTKTIMEFKIHTSHHGEEEKFKCDFCSYSVDRINSLTHHRKLHAKQQGYEANLPPEKFYNPQYDNLSNGQVDSSDSDGPKGLVQCEKCPYVCPRLQAMRSHEKLHGANKKHVCSHCDWSTDRQNLLVQHERIHASSEPVEKPTTVFQCHSCEFTTTSIYVLSSHQSDHAADGLNNNVEGSDKVDDTKSSPSGKRERFKCSVCPYHTSTQTLLNSHIKQHS